MATTFHDFTMKTIDGEAKPLSDFAGKVLLVVNVASKCGLTPQYTALEELHERYAGRGFSVLGFPCNDFAGQEPAPESEIKEFCSTNYDVSFPLFAKIHVLGGEQAPLYAFMTGQTAPPKGPGDVTWNFEKFLVDKSGHVVARFAPGTVPLDADITAEVERALA
ncbi:MAG TPA: glutathione peroxidase [Polyangiaceae bacterium]